jgi:DNA replication licensing factor MCM2
MGKSQFLKYMEKIAERAIYTTGKGASAVGLTASVHKDPMTNEWVLEGGALVLADRGLCLIDEFDKMNDKDRVSIHEAMEQQSISISKAGIVAQLQARCSIIAAANPVNGCYDSSCSFSQNVGLSDPIISRFDIICVIKDSVDPSLDEQKANFVVNSHASFSTPHESFKKDNMTCEILPSKLLKSYIHYAKYNIKPKLHSREDEKIAKAYVILRKGSSVFAGIPIAVRHLESMIRIAEAHARLNLRENVTPNDVDLAIKMMVESYISTQSSRVQKLLRLKFRHLIVLKKDIYELTLSKLQHLMKVQLKLEACIGIQESDDLNSSFVHVKVSDLKRSILEYNILDIDSFLNDERFISAGFKLTKDRNTILHYK